MSKLPSTERLLLGPGPSPMAPRVMQALGAPMLSHLDPDFLPIMDDVRLRLQGLYRADQKAFTIAISGTGTSGMEAAVANAVTEGTRAVVVVTGYFGDRLAQICSRYGAKVRRVEVEWGRACDPQRLRDELVAESADIVAFVHAETSTGVRNPVQELAAVAREQGAMTIVDMVTSLGGHEVALEEWGIDIAYSCTQKCIGAPSGLSPIAVSGPARAQIMASVQKNNSRSFYLDFNLLEDYWINRKYHHTMSASLIYALHEALLMIDEEGLEARWARHKWNHLALAAGLEAIGLGLLPPESERLWTLNAVKIPKGINEAAVRKMLLQTFNIEIGAGLGPLAGKVWRVGLMGAGSKPYSVIVLLGALEAALLAQGYQESTAGAGTAAATVILASMPDTT